jgi:subtilisin family serine protease
MSVNNTGFESVFSNFDVNLYNGVEYEVYAPGEDMLSTIPGNRYASWDGTSMAAPVVCGGLALALEKANNIQPEEIKIMLYETVDPEEILKKHAWGILNVDKLVGML